MTTVAAVGSWIVVVDPAVATEIVGAVTVPFGVYVGVSVPASVPVTVAVTLEFVKLILPAGVKAPVEVVDLPVYVILTLPPGVYVVSPSPVDTAAVLFAVVRETEPYGVNLPVDETVPPVNSAVIEPAGVYSVSIVVAFEVNLISPAAVTVPLAVTAPSASSAENVPAGVYVVLPVALSAKASAFNEPVEPSSYHAVPLNKNSRSWLPAFAMLTMSPCLASTVLPLMTTDNVVSPSPESSVVVLPM